VLDQTLRDLATRSSPVGRVFDQVIHRDSGQRTVTITATHAPCMLKNARAGGAEHFGELPDVVAACSEICGCARDSVSALGPALDVLGDDIAIQAALLDDAPGDAVGLVLGGDRIMAILPLKLVGGCVDVRRLLFQQACCTLRPASGILIT